MNELQHMKQYIVWLGNPADAKWFIGKWDEEAQAFWGPDGFRYKMNRVGKYKAK